MLLSTGSGRFELPIPPGHAVAHIPAWYHLPENSDADRPIVIVLHGTSRAARASRDNWSVQAERYGFFVVVPEFALQDFPDPDYAYGGLWAPRPPYQRADWSESHGAILDRLFEAVNGALGGQHRQFILYGHSAGAAFAHRYMTFTPDDRVSHAIFANAGWYTMPDGSAALPFGLLGSGLSLESLGHLLRKPITILVGDRDRTGPYPPWWPEGYMQQGLHRVGRSQAYFEAARQMAAQLGVPFGWRWQSVPDVAHENARMIPPAAELIGKAILTR